MPYLRAMSAPMPLVAPVISYLAVERGMGFALPMMVSTMASLLLVIVFVLLGPETKGKRLD